MHTPRLYLHLALTICVVRKPQLASADSLISNPVISSNVGCYHTRANWLAASTDSQSSILIIRSSVGFCCAHPKHI